jgi:hypothetical protein
MYYCGKFTASTVGQRTILGLPFTPKRLKFTVNKTSGLSCLSSGEASNAGQQAHTTYFDIDPSGETLSDLTRCITHYERQNGVLVKVLSVSFMSFGVNRFKINTHVASATTQLFVEAFA